jgi:hypothetical protein
MESVKCLFDYFETSGVENLELRQRKRIVIGEAWMQEQVAAN